MDFTNLKQDIFSCVVCKAANHLNSDLAVMQNNCYGFHNCAGVAPISFDLDMPQEVNLQFFGKHAMIRESVDDIKYRTTKQQHISVFIYRILCFWLYYVSSSLPAFCFKGLRNLFLILHDYGFIQQGNFRLSGFPLQG